MKAKRIVEWTMGFAAGLLAPIFGLFVFISNNPEIKNGEFENMEAFQSLIFQIVSVGLILNMGLFFVALKFDKEIISKGVMHASVVFLIAIVVYKFIL